MGPEAFVFTPDGRTAYVLSQDNIPGVGATAGPGYLTLIDTATDTRWPHGLRDGTRAAAP